MNDAFTAYEPDRPDHGITPGRSRDNLNHLIDAIRAERPRGEIILQTMNPSWGALSGRCS